MLDVRNVSKCELKIGDNGESVFSKYTKYKSHPWLFIVIKCVNLIFQQQKKVCQFPPKPQFLCAKTSHMNKETCTFQELKYHQPQDMNNTVKM